MTNYISTVGMSRQEWLRARQNGIGGSDAAALVLPPEDYKYSRPADVYISKVEPPDESSPLCCRMGTYLEPFVAELFCEATGKKVHRINKIIISGEHPFMFANIDRKISGENAGLECKTTSAFSANSFSKTDYPLNYYTQMQHYMAVTGWDKWYLAVLIGNKQFMWYEVPRSDKGIKKIIEIESEFWNKVVVPRNTEELERWL